MNEAFIALGVAAAVWGVFIFFRAPSIVLFLSLLVGQLLATQESEQVHSWVSSVAQVKDFRYIQLALLVLPVILTLIILRFRVTKPKLPLEAISYLFIAAAATLFAADYLPILQQKVQLTEHQFGAYGSAIIAAASVASLINAWVTYPKHHGHGLKHHK